MVRVAAGCGISPTLPLLDAPLVVASSRARLISSCCSFSASSRARFFCASLPLTGRREDLFVAESKYGFISTRDRAIGNGSSNPTGGGLMVRLHLLATLTAPLRYLVPTFDRAALSTSRLINL